MEHGVEFNLKIIILTSASVRGHREWVCERAALGLEVGVGAQTRQQGQEPWNRQRLAWLAPALSLLCRMTTPPPREQGRQGAFAQHYCPFCAVPGRTKASSAPWQLPTLATSGPFFSVKQWTGSAAGWGSRIRLLGWAAPSPDSQERGCLEAWQE